MCEWEHLAAKCRQDSPARLRSLMFALLSSKHLTTLSHPSHEAHKRGVRLQMLMAPMAALRSISSSTASRWLHEAASIRGVLPTESRTETPPPSLLSSSHRKILEEPAFAAMRTTPCPFISFALTSAFFFTSHSAVWCWLPAIATKSGVWPEVFRCSMDAGFLSSSHCKHQRLPSFAADRISVFPPASALSAPPIATSSRATLRLSLTTA
mmetsp:Transcript_17939/g.28608  ORF Transcript_17939/g.28608 Transcript_17939/m.28608 type:complete len:210 (+) Transcript_17939:393-1022(+)